MEDNDNNGPQLVEDQAPVEQAEQPVPEQQGQPEQQEQQVPMGPQIAMPRCGACGQQPFQPVMLDLNNCLNAGVPLPEGTVLKVVSCQMCGAIVTFLPVKRQSQPPSLIAPVGSIPRFRSN
jgi:hypothetical protein